MAPSLSGSERSALAPVLAVLLPLVVLASPGLRAQESLPVDDGSTPGAASALPSAGPSSVSTTQLTDPITGQVFETEVLLFSNGRGGYDSDGCPYSQGPQPRSYAIATSPYTFYSAPVELFGKGLPASAVPALRAHLQQFAEKGGAAGLTPTRRYELAARVAEHLGQGPYVVGDHLLAAAWTVRDRIVGFLPAVQGAGDAWAKLVAVLPDYRGVTNLRGRTIASFDLARLSHRGGFGSERDAFLAELDGFPDAGLGALGKRDEFRRLVLDEQVLLRAARERFEEGLRLGLGSSEDRSYRRYLVGDLSRRLGELDRAGQELQAVATDKGTSPEVLGVVKDILAVLELQGSKSSALDLSRTNEAGGTP